MPDGRMGSQSPPGQALENFTRNMKRDWDRRAVRNAKWFINTVGTNQSESEFDQTGEQEVEWLVKSDLDMLACGRDPGTLRVLEIGSGIGRMTRFLATIFGEVHAVDVSGEMIARAKRRLLGVPNVYLQETNGVDFRAFPADFFDVVFCAYVFQHVPDRAVIESNLRDAYRVLRPGGIFKFQTNGVDNPVFDSATKDTWVGDTFPEAEIRGLARGLGAGLMSIAGAGTQYCWAVWRKPAKKPSGPSGVARILSVHQQEGVMDAGAPDHLVIRADGIDRDFLDANLLTIRVNGIEVTPFYAGPAWRLSGETRTEESLSGGEAALIEAVLPNGIGTGTAPVSLLLGGTEIAGPVAVELREPCAMRTRIVSITNAADGGRDIYALGAKSQVRIFMDGLGKAGQEGVQVILGDRAVEGPPPSFIPGNGFYMTLIRIPEGLESGPVPVRVKVGESVSREEMMCLRKGRDPVERFHRRAVKRVGRLLSRLLWKIPY